MSEQTQEELQKYLDDHRKDINTTNKRIKNLEEINVSTLMKINEINRAAYREGYTLT